MSHKAPSRLRTDDRGQAIVEFALVIGFLVIMVVSILEMSLFLYTYSMLTDAAKEGVRYAIVHGSGGTAASPTGSGDCGSAMSGLPALLAKYSTALSLHTLSSSNISVNCPDGNAPGNLVTVGVSYPFQPLFLTNWASVTISATSVGRIQF